MRYWIVLALAVPSSVAVGKFLGLESWTWELAAFLALVFWLLTLGEWYGKGK